MEGAVKTVRSRTEDGELVRLMSDTMWHPLHVLEKQKDGPTAMTLRVTDAAEFYYWILGWGKTVEVLEPRELRDEIGNTAERMMEIYEKDQGF